MNEYQSSHISYTYEDRLNASYPGDRKIVSTLARGWQEARLAEQPSQTIDYVRVGSTPETQRPVLLVPGFTETIVSNAPFAAEMATRGFDLIVPGQNRKGILRNLDYKKDATFTQAVNDLSVLKAEGLLEGGVDVITHSYGSLIFQAMADIAQQTGHDTFAGSNVVMLAPAGASGKAEDPWNLYRRWYRSVFKQNNLIPEEFGASAREMMKSATRVGRANPARTLREVFDLKNKQLDLSKLMESGIAHLCVMGFAEDLLYSHDFIEPAVRSAQQADKAVSYAVPVNYECDENGMWQRCQIAAVHSDGQFSPKRVAGAVAQVLRDY